LLKVVAMISDMFGPGVRPSSMQAAMKARTTSGDIVGSQLSVWWGYPLAASRKVDQSSDRAHVVQCPRPCVTPRLILRGRKIMKLMPMLSITALAAVSLTVAVRAGGDLVTFPQNYAQGVLYTTV